MYVCMCRIYTHTYTLIYIQVIRMYVCTHACMCVSICMYVQNRYTHIHTYTLIYMQIIPCNTQHNVFR